MRLSCWSYPLVCRTISMKARRFGVSDTKSTGIFRFSNFRARTTVMISPIPSSASASIRGRSVDKFRAAFDSELKSMIAARRNVQDAEPLSYAALNTRFKRYFFARVDEFLAENMNMNPKHPIGDLVMKTGAKTGFHVEHILSWNQENRVLFSNDEERFEQERNRLGGILLLKGKDNISSNNESYSHKLKSYANTLYWNETLRADSYKSKLDLKELCIKFKLDLKPFDQFGPKELETRHRLLFEISKIIWGLAV